MTRNRVKRFFQIAREIDHEIPLIERITFRILLLALAVVEVLHIFCR